MFETTLTSAATIAHHQALAVVERHGHQLAHRVTRVARARAALTGALTRRNRSAVPASAAKPVAPARVTKGALAS